MEESRHLCPCCGRHCSLDAPHCQQGVEYAKTGVIPSQPHHDGEHQDGHHGGHHGKGRHSAHMQRYQKLDIDNKLVFNLRDLGHRIRDFSDGKAGQSRILSILKESQPMTQSSLTEQLGVQPGTVSEVLGKLENAGLIIRTPSQQDRRTSIIELTASGLEAAETAMEQKQQRQAEMFSCLSEEEKNTFLVFLETLNHDWHLRYGRGDGGRHRRG